MVALHETRSFSSEYPLYLFTHFQNTSWHVPCALSELDDRDTVRRQRWPRFTTQSTDLSRD